MSIHTCPDCGAAWGADETCETFFHQLLYWEMENSDFLEVHHFMVLCYHLQHPHLYSQKGLTHAQGLLETFIESNVTTEDVRKQNRDIVDSGKRKWSIKATADSKGSYPHPIAWTMNIHDVIENGKDHYCDSVRAWAKAVYNDLQDFARP